MRLKGNFCNRLLYTHPAHYTEEFIDFMARGNTKVLPYLDIPLQHISDRIPETDEPPRDPEADRRTPDETAASGFPA